MKQPKLLSLLIAIGLSLVIVTSFAQEVSRRAQLAGELLDLLNMQKMFDAAFDSIPKMQAQMFASEHMKPEEQAKFNRQMQASMIATKKSMDWDSLKPIFVKIYADNFDEAELEGTIAYYKSPVGRRWIEKQPQIQAATMQAMAQLMPKIQAAVQKAFTENNEKADAGDAGTPAGAPSPTPR